MFPSGVFGPDGEDRRPGERLLGPPPLYRGDTDQTVSIPRGTINFNKAD